MIQLIGKRARQAGETQDTECITQNAGVVMI